MGDLTIKMVTLRNHYYTVRFQGDQPYSVHRYVGQVGNKAAHQRRIWEHGKGEPKGVAAEAIACVNNPHFATAMRATVQDG